MRIIFSRKERKAMREEGLDNKDFKRIKLAMEIEFDEMKNSIIEEKED